VKAPATTSADRYNRIAAARAAVMAARGFREVVVRSFTGVERRAILGQLLNARADPFPEADQFARYGFVRAGGEASIVAGSRAASSAC
jgi:hypothetical protein